MKTNNRPMVKETITEHKYMNCETKEICWFDLSTGPKWFETTHYPVNDETRTREVERPMYDTEYIEYLEKEVNERTIVARNLMGNSLSLQRENQELKDKQLEDKKLINKLNYDLEHYGENRTLAGRQIYVDKQVSEIIDRQYKELLEKDNIIIGLQEKLMDRDYSDKNYQAYLKLETEYQCLLSNNNELKEQLRNKTVESDKHLAIATEIAVELEQTQDKILELVWHTIVDFELTNDITNEKETLAPHIVSLIVKKIKKGIEDEHK